MTINKGDWILADTFREFVRGAPYTRIKILEVYDNNEYYGYHYNPLIPEGHEHGLYDSGQWPVIRKMRQSEIDSLPSDVLESAE